MQAVSQVVDEIFRHESQRVLATLIRLVGDFDLAEDALQEALTAALQQWPSEGVPQNPRAWLVSTARFKAIDLIRRRVRFAASYSELTELPVAPHELDEDAHLPDDTLRLIFACCHPVLPSEAQAALTLREVCGLTTEEIGRAFLTPTTTIAQRIVRAKAKIREAQIPYEVPSPAELVERIQDVLRVTYLLFNEGYYSSSGETATREVLSAEAIRLGRLLIELIPLPEVQGLLALMLIHESRRLARTGLDGELILMEDQDRTKWDRALIDEGQRLAMEASKSGKLGHYALQAAIASIHASAKVAGETDWAEIVRMYDQMLIIHDSPVVALNRAVAVAMASGPAEGLVLIDDLLLRDELQRYGLAHSARANLCRRLGQTEAAIRSYKRALELATQDPERNFLAAKLAELHRMSK